MDTDTNRLLKVRMVLYTYKMLRDVHKSSEGELSFDDLSYKDIIEALKVGTTMYIYDICDSKPSVALSRFNANTTNSINMRRLGESWGISGLIPDKGTGRSTPHADGAKTKAKNKIKAKAKPKVKVKSKPKAKPKAKPKTKVKEKVKEKAEVKAKAKPLPPIKMASTKIINYVKRSMY